MQCSCNGIATLQPLTDFIYNHYRQYLKFFINSFSKHVLAKRIHVGIVMYTNDCICKVSNDLAAAECANGQLCRNY